VAIVGSPLDDDNGLDAGAAYIFARDEGGSGNWGEVVKLVASDGFGGHNFGIAVSISGDFAIVGAFQENSAGLDSGAAYLFARNEGGTDNWGELTKLVASDASADSWFGARVSISGNTVVVGAFRNDAIDANSGAVYVFSRNQGGSDNWGELTKITPSDGAADDFSAQVS